MRTKSTHAQKASKHKLSNINTRKQGKKKGFV